MAQTGDSFTVELNKAQLEWGTYRFTGSRGIRYGEGYLKIPRNYARLYNLYNGNHTQKQDILGENIFHATSKDGLFNGFFVHRVVLTPAIHWQNNLRATKILWL